MTTDIPAASLRSPLPRSEVIRRRCRRFAITALNLAIAVLSTPAVGQPRQGEMAGYLLVPNEKVPESFDAGFSMYVAAWPLVKAYPGPRFQTGLFGTWMFARHDQPRDFKLYLNTKNFKGPVAFFTPFFWSRGAVEDPRFAGLLLDSRPSNPNRALQMETQHVPAAQATDAKGDFYARIAPTRFPRTADGESLVVHRITSYNRSALWDAVKTWFAGGPEASGRIREDGAVLHTFPGRGGATWQIYTDGTPSEAKLPLAWTSLVTPMAADPHTFGYRWQPELLVPSPESRLVTLPEFYRLATNANSKAEWVPVRAEDVPTETGLAQVRFDRHRGKPQDPYVTPDAPTSSWKQPGPTAGPFQAKLGDGSVVTYYWYRFADQPSLLNADLTAAEREALQTRVEKLHRAWTKDREYLPPPTLGELAGLDPALVLTPPPGLEAGYVPIATRQESAGEAYSATLDGANACSLDHLGVPETRVDTVVGHLPKLPRTLRSLHQDGTSGPEVRVIWPSPTNNLAVLEPGTYTVTGRVAGTQLQPRATVTVQAETTESHRPRRQTEAFPLDRVTLNLDEHGRKTPFIQHRDKFIDGLARTNPDRFLYMFRDAFGQPQPPNTEPLGVWDSQTTRLRGHASGHYLSAIAQAYASTGHDPELQANFRQKMNDLIDTLYNLAQLSGRPARPGGPFNADPTTIPPGPGKTTYDSDLSADGIRTDAWNWGRGFLSAYPPDQFIMLELGATYGSNNDQVWAPYYTLHKILAGLLDCLELGGNRKALDIAQGMGLWVHQRLQAVPTATRISMWNRYIAGEYGGMNEVMARLYRLTGDQRFLDCARLFDNITLFYGDAEHTHGLARNVDTFRGKHANQHIPQITGALELYRNTGELPYYLIADNFWHICTECYLYSIGGVAGARNPDNPECFTAEPDSLFAQGFAPGGQNETCATYNLLKLSRELFLYQPESRYLDYYEQALYNDILASVAADHPGNTYHIPLNPGSRKDFGNAAMDGFTCCNGTALESGTKLQDSIYFRGADHQSLTVNLFVPSTLTWTERNITVTQRTSFPYADTTRLTISGGGAFELKIRVPRWATRGFHLSVNGQPAAANASPGSFATVHRTWSDNDLVEIRIPFSFHLHRLMDQPNIASLFYGPILLAAQEPGPRSDWRPVNLDPSDIARSLDGDPATLRFRLGDLHFRPFYESYGHYSVYLDVQDK